MLRGLYPEPRALLLLILYRMVPSFHHLRILRLRTAPSLTETGTISETNCSNMVNYIVVDEAAVKAHAAATVTQ